MSRKKAVAALALVVAFSFAVPALAGKSSPIKLAKKALKLSKKSDKRSRTALKRANAARSAAGAANANAASALQKLAGAQPEAVHATNADHAAIADRAGGLEGLTVLPLIKVQPTNGPDFAAARAGAPEIALFGKGPLRVYAKCFSYVSGNPAVEAEVYVATNQDGVVFSSSGNSDSGNDYLKAGTPEDNRILHSQGSQDSVGSVNSGDAQDGEFYAFAPDGTVLQGHVSLAAKQGDPAVGNGPFGAGSGCLFSGRAYGS